MKKKSNLICDPYGSWSKDPVTVSVNKLIAREHLINGKTKRQLADEYGYPVQTISARIRIALLSSGKEGDELREASAKIKHREYKSIRRPFQLKENLKEISKSNQAVIDWFNQMSHEERNNKYFFDQALAIAHVELGASMVTLSEVSGLTISSIQQRISFGLLSAIDDYDLKVVPSINRYLINKKFTAKAEFLRKRLATRSKREIDAALKEIYSDPNYRYIFDCLNLLESL